MFPSIHKKITIYFLKWMINNLFNYTISAYIDQKNTISAYIDKKNTICLYSIKTYVIYKFHISYFDKLFTWAYENKLKTDY